LSTLILRIQMPVILTFFNTMQGPIAYSRCVAHTQSNW